MRRVSEWSDALMALGLIAVAVVSYIGWFALHDGSVPAGSFVGHALGVVGYLLMLWAAFGYSWRKRPSHEGPGNAQAWMRSHVIAGLVGPVLVILHTGFAYRGLAGVATLLVLVVVASGVVGRYVYAGLSRDARPDDDDALRQLDDEIARLELERAIVAEEEGAHVMKGGSPVAAAVPVAFRSAVEAQHRTALRLRAEYMRRASRGRVNARRRRLLAWWWLLHVPASAAMLLLGLVHALAALYYAGFPANGG